MIHARAGAVENSSDITARPKRWRDLAADLNIFAFTPKAKVLGGTLTVSTAIPIVNTPVSIPRVGADFGGVGLGDI